MLVQKFVLLCDRLVHRPDRSNMGGGGGGGGRDLSTQDSFIILLVLYISVNPTVYVWHALGSC